jgi:FHA domain
MNSYQFPTQKLLFDKKPLSKELLKSLLEMVYDTSPPFTGFIQFDGDDFSLNFLFFFNGAPYAAGRCNDGRSVSYSIQELCSLLTKTSKNTLTVSVCQTDPVLLKSMLLFTQGEPDVKAPTSLLDCEYIVEQIGEAGVNAMVALSRDKYINFFFFREGKAARAYFADSSFERPKGMSVDEEMLLYAYQPGSKVQALVFRDMSTTMAEDSNLLDQSSLINLLTLGYLKNRRKNDAEKSNSPALAHENRRSTDTAISSIATKDGIDVLVRVLGEKQKFPNVLLTVESGTQQGERFAVTLPCTIGRKGCDLILDNRLVSRRHAELKQLDDKLIIEDLESKNGTKVNGKKIRREFIAPNDIVSIGPISVRISNA